MGVRYSSVWRSGQKRVGMGTKEGRQAHAPVYPKPVEFSIKIAKL